MIYGSQKIWRNKNLANWLYQAFGEFLICRYSTSDECASVNYAEQYKLICVPSRLDHYSALWYCLLQLISWPTTVIDVMTFSKL